MAIDVFSKFVETKAISSVKADECVEFLVEYCARFGVPNEILTDNAAQFENKFINEALKLFGIAHRLATPEHSQSNAPVERVIQTLQEKLAIATADSKTKDSWDIILPIITQSLNSSYHSATKYTPYELVFGRKIPIISNQVIEQSTPQDLHLQLIQSQLRELHDAAVSNQLDSQSQSRKYFNPREVSFEIDDLCMSNERSRRKSKLGSRYRGPFRVISKDKDIYTLENLENNRIIQRHVASLKKYYPRQNQRVEEEDSN